MTDRVQPVTVSLTPFGLFVFWTLFHYALHSQHILIGYHMKNYANFFVHTPTFSTSEFVPQPVVLV